MNNKLIGVLAGMGPRSTAPFIDLVISECQSQYGAKYDDEFPPIMIYSLPTPFYIDRPINHEQMKETIIAGLKKLETIGVSFIAMPCNSAHIYFKDLKDSINIPLLNIVEETLKQLPKAPQRVTVLATKSTLESEIYQKGIVNYNHQFVFNEKWQDKINCLIQSIKNDKDDINNSIMWEELIYEVKKAGVEYVIIACTDLNVVLTKTYSGTTFIDSSKCLAETVVNQYINLNGRY